MINVIVSPEARQDINDIWAYIAVDNVDAADRVIDAFEAAFHKLFEMPGMGHIRTELQNANLRVFNVFSYLIIYKIGTMPLEIVRIVSGYRDITKLQEN